MQAQRHSEEPYEDGFEALDVCHRHTLFTLGKLSALVSRLRQLGPDAHAREMAAEIIHHFSTTARRHHEDEELHLFPRLLLGADPEMVQDLQRLKQDHGWLEEDWQELSPVLDAVANGHSWYDMDALEEAVRVFIALSHDHMALEEACIYPEARARLSSRQRWEMGREMAARRRQARSAPDDCIE